jgi:hypothetical protein
MVISIKTPFWRLVGAGAGVLVLALVAGAAAMLTVTDAPSARVGALNTTEEGVAISGYDTVAYFTEGHPMKGSAEFKHACQDAQWHFPNEAHRDIFADDPERFAPEFGGFCATGMTYGAVAKADPEVWTIVDDKLYLNFDDYAHEIFHDNVARNIASAERKWAETIEAERIEQAQAVQAR